MPRWQFPFPNKFAPTNNWVLTDQTAQSWPYALPLGQQIEWFERIFGFSFPESHKFISKINNQSLYTINQLFPNLIELNNNNSFFKVDPIKVVSSKSGHLIPLKTSKETTLLSIEMLDKVHSLDKYEST